MKYISLILVLLSGLCFAVKAEHVTIVAYCPAPGQFVNTMPKATADDDSIGMASAAQQQLERGSMINLGGFGGYVIAKFDAPLTNQDTDDFDFIIEGNAYEGNSEPGVVWVSADANRNGLPDDPWYELYGSEAERSIRNYTITYYRPAKDDDEASAEITEYIRWEDNQGGSGYIPKNTFHKQSYFPLWTDAESLSFTGTLLPDNAENRDGIWILGSYGWGYADNKPNKDTEGNSFKMEWARNADGSPANLTTVDFVKIHTGINKINGVIGENSTEITGIRPIRENATASVSSPNDIGYFINQNTNTIIFGQRMPQVAVVNITGQTIAAYTDTDTIDFGALSQGIYICVTPEHTFKFIRK